MVKKIAFSLLIFLIIPTVFAIEMEVTPKQDYGILVVDTNTPALYDISVKNKGTIDYVTFYNLAGFRMAPFGSEKFLPLETKEIQLIFYPPENFNQRGFYIFPYYIRSSDGSEIEEKAMVKIIELKDVFEVGSGDFDPSSNSVEIFIQNKEKLRFHKINAVFKSSFFDFEKEFSLEPLERKSFTVKLDKENFKKLMAGFYTLNSDVIVDGKKENIQGTIKFTEKDILTTNKKEFGLFINTNIIKKSNEGNIITSSEITIEKNIISRLFTTLNPEPTSVDRSGFEVFYSWNKNLKPGESLEVKITTNWFYPFLIILLIVLIAVLVKKYTTGNLNLRKKVSFVKTKGGEFALKVSIIVEARKHTEKITIIDKIPSIVDIYGKFPAVERPTKVDTKNKRIEWNISELNSGERRILSYIIFSKVGILGKFELPSATAIYESEEKVIESRSNKAFFVSEQRKEFITED